MAKTNIEIDGKPVGRFRAGWILFKESWRYLQADKEIVLIPLITGLLNLLLFGFIFGAAFFLILNGTLTVSEEGQSATVGEYIFYFCIYVAGAFTLALSQAGVAHTVYTRAHGGNATLGESLKVAFSHSGSLLLWAAITSTVGLILRTIAERSKLLGRIVVALFGLAWSILTYFVVPAIVLDKKSAPAAIGHSIRVIRQTWGEAAVSNISLGVVFLVVYVVLLFSGFGLLVVAFGAESLSLVWMVMTLLFLAIMVVALIQSALESVIRTLLYVYAAEGVQPPNFNSDLLRKMLKRKDGSSPEPPAASAPPTTSQASAAPPMPNSFAPHSVDHR